VSAHFFLLYYHNADNMSRVRKSVAYERRIGLIELIDKHGYEVMPCSYCFDRDLKCEMMDGVARCKECVRRGRKCDGTGASLSSVQSVLYEQDRLEKEEELAEEKLIRAQQEAATALARLSRLRKQKRFLRERSLQMAQRNAKSLDELDELERKEAEASDAVATAFGTVSPLDWAQNGVGVVDPSLWSLQVGVPGESPPTPSATAEGGS
jgi:hypothetical protein